MFDYPLPKPAKTLYHQIGSEPFATQEELRDAWKEATKELKNRIAGLQKQLALIYKKLPKLEILKKSLEQSHGQGQEAARELAELEKQAIEIEPNYRSLAEDLKACNEELIGLNSLSILTPEGREEYDLATPPCALLRMDNYQVKVFHDRKLSFFLLRKECSRFWEREQNHACFHPSDLTRTDFTADFRHCVLLDNKPPVPPKK